VSAATIRSSSACAARPRATCAPSPAWIGRAAARPERAPRQLDAAGSAPIGLHPGTQEGLVPRRGGPLRVTVHATAPGGHEATVARRDVRVRHAFVPPPRRPRDVRVTRRRGGRLLVTWRTAKPARAQEFFLSAERRRADGSIEVLALGFRDGNGRTRCREVLEDEGRARWVKIERVSSEPRLKGGSIRVPVGRAT